METISMLFVGSLNNTYATAGVGLGIIYVNCTTQSTLTGLNNSISVLVAVAYGKNDIKECERVLNRGRILCLIFYVPLIICEFLCYPALTAAGVDPEVAYFA